MADFPLASHSEAVSKVLLTVLPPRAYGYAVLFLPGLFFEVSICLANPQFVQKLIASSNEAANLGRYPKILVAVFLAFVVGNAFMLWVGVVHRTLVRIFRLSRYLWRRFCMWPLLPVLRYLSSAQALPAADRSVPLLPFAAWFGRAKNWLSHQQWMQKSIQRAQDTAFGHERDSAGARRLWATLARSLFKKHYGVDIAGLSQEEWDALYEAVGGVSPISFSDHMLLTASQGLGWSGIAATRFAPALINRNYIAFNLFLIAIGIFYELWLIRGQFSEFGIGILRVRAILRELKKGQVRGTQDSTKPPTSTDTPPTEE